ncbi:hypothetical protein J1N35_026115 [Gossypium stocksii]|uniref:phosphoethanolamine N-methyltransferase n=1 Tax=Gossypium stocksii TaxID=47602 RepID=A0A9D3ZXU5_9ROSI|nr:hypothetical protein J1N35_026115 [Gossypium stocksii]
MAQRIILHANSGDINRWEESGMMVESQKSNLKQSVLSLLLPYEGKSILELGAGIGRFTGELAQKADSVIALDFIEDVIKKNESINGHYKNIKLLCPNATSLYFDISDGSMDLIFSNLLLMYLSDEEICWIWEKVSSDNDGGFQWFLDTVQYKANSILRYERTFSEGFVSTGGIETMKEFMAKLDLKPGQKVLDVGYGIGGGDFYMAKEFGVYVVGIDLSINMISFTLERANGLNCSVEFEVADCTTKTYLDNSFDVIYSRDTILHIQPGGNVLISDYCKNVRASSPEFVEYIKQRSYDLHDEKAYGQV